MELILLKNIDKNNKSFEDIKHIDEDGIEFWYARELMPILQYSNWQNFEKIIHKAKISCKNSDISVFDHFTDVSKTIKMPKGAEKKLLLLPKLILQYKQENKKLQKKNTVC